MDRLRVDYSRIRNLDVERLRQPVPRGGPPRRRLSAIERPLASAAISVLPGPTGNIMREIWALGETSRSIPVQLISGVSSGVATLVTAPRSLSVITGGVGTGGSVFAGSGITGGAGIYASNTPEVGIYFSAGIGLWTNIGGGLGGVITLIFGPPSAFGGVSWGVGVEVSFTVGGIGAPAGVGAMALFGMSGPPFQFLGLCFSVGASWTTLPVNITVQASRTSTHPIWRP